MVITFDANASMWCCFNFGRPVSSSTLVGRNMNCALLFVKINGHEFARKTSATHGAEVTDQRLGLSVSTQQKTV
jgi:hypothetical protein